MAIEVLPSLHENVVQSAWRSRNPQCRNSIQLPQTLTGELGTPGTPRFPFPACANADGTGTFEDNSGFMAEAHCLPGIRLRSRVSQSVDPTFADVLQCPSRPIHERDQSSQLDRHAIKGRSKESGAEIGPGLIHFRLTHE